MKKHLLTILFIVTLIGCEKPNTEDINYKKNTLFKSTDYSAKENPFSVETMQSALNVLQKEGRLDLGDFKDFEVKPTHYYVKFSPKNEDEEGLIKSDSTYFVFDYPLHLTEKEEEIYLEKREPLKEDEDGIQIEFSEYYSSIPVEQIKQLPFKCTIIDELYIPEEDPYFDSVDQDGDLKGPIKTKDDLFENILYKAYELTGRENELIEEDDYSEEPTPKTNIPSIWFIGKKWNPSGTLTIYDDVMAKCIPLKGAQVLMRQVFTIRQGITDQNGYFKTKSIRGKARYILQWERYHYSIRSDAFRQAETKGPKVKKKAWTYCIQGDYEKYYGTIHHAAHLYYYTPIFGFASPPKNGTLKRQMKIAARKQTGSSSHVNERALYFGSQISIKEWRKNSESVFGTTIHELTHAAHLSFDKSSYNTLVKKAYIPPFSSAKDSAKRLLETWATTAEIYLTNHWYSIVLGNSSYKFKTDNYQNQLIYNPNSSRVKYYTSAGFDMIDYFNQGATYGSSYPTDRVSGYTPAQLQQSLRGATHWNGWKDRIKSQHTNPTSIYLDELFANW